MKRSNSSSEYENQLLKLLNPLKVLEIQKNNEYWSWDNNQEKNKGKNPNTILATIAPILEISYSTEKYYGKGSSSKDPAPVPATLGDHEGIFQSITRLPHPITISETVPFFNSISTTPGYSDTAEHHVITATTAFTEDISITNKINESVVTTPSLITEGDAQSFGNESGVNYHSEEPSSLYDIYAGVMIVLSILALAMISATILLIIKFRSKSFHFRSNPSNFVIVLLLAKEIIHSVFYFGNAVQVLAKDTRVEEKFLNSVAVGMDSGLLACALASVGGLTAERILASGWPNRELYGKYIKEQNALRFIAIVGVVAVSVGVYAFLGFQQLKNEAKALTLSWLGASNQQTLSTLLLVVLFIGAASSTTLLVIRLFLEKHLMPISPKHFPPLSISTLQSQSLNRMYPLHSSSNLDVVHEEHMAGSHVFYPQESLPKPSLEEFFEKSSIPSIPGLHPPIPAPKLFAFDRKGELRIESVRTNCHLTNSVVAVSLYIVCLNFPLILLLVGRVILGILTDAHPGINAFVDLFRAFEGSTIALSLILCRDDIPSLLNFEVMSKRAKVEPKQEEFEAGPGSFDDWDA